MKNVLLTLMAVFIFNGLYAQEKKSKFETVTIQTSAQCGDCKTRIEDGLNYTKGVKFAELDLITKKVTVKYAAEKISLQQVKEKINSIGYDADEMKANPESILKLPACCQPEGMKQ
jgi:copper chaperone CopZ